MSLDQNTQAPARLNASARIEELCQSALERDRSQTDRLFLGLLTLQWIAAIAVAYWISPQAWALKVGAASYQVTETLLMGAAINAVPIALILLRPGQAVTRHAVAAAQLLWSALFIHLTAGRMAAHSHVLVSLAFIAVYRDWRVFLTANAVLVVDYAVLGAYWPESLYGVTNPEWWLPLEHGAWAGFEQVVLLTGCIRGVREVRQVAEREAALEGMNAAIEREVRAKTVELEASVEQATRIAEITGIVPCEMEAEGLTFTHLPALAVRVFGPDAHQLLGAVVWPRIAEPDRDRVKQQLEALAKGGDRENLETEFRLASGEGAPYLRFIFGVHHPEGQPKRLRGIVRDITEQKKREHKVSQSQKLESVGRLAAGVAHEINTPVQFVSDSIHFVRDVMSDLVGLNRAYQEAIRSIAAGGAVADAIAAFTRAEVDADLEYILEHLPKAIDRSLEGLDRVSTIVRSMKEFSHPDHSMTAVDVNQAITSTLVIARHEYKFIADVTTDLGDIPRVTCYGGDINQVILNLIVNASHAIEDVVKDTSDKGSIVVRTWLEGEMVVIAITDSGAGIPEVIRGRIFDPFFTTKAVGKGTGQGLSLARSVVVEKHHGELTFDSQVGLGTTFFIRLPVAGRGLAGVAA